MITSAISNKLSTTLRKLQQKKQRKQLGLCTVEGLKGVQEALSANLVEAIIIERGYSGEIPRFEHVYDASPGELKDLQQTETFPGIMAVCRIPEAREIGDGHVLILDRIADPGNMGTMIRTADWFGIKDVVLSPGCTDPFAPKVVRSTMGAIFRANIVMSTDIVQTISDLKRMGKVVVSLDMKGHPLSTLKSGQKYGCIVGSESHGVDKKLLSQSDQTISIPGAGQGESLNAAISAGIVMNAIYNH